MSGIVNKTHTGLMQFMPFLFLFSSVNTSKTIDGGMSKLPEQCAKLVEHEGGVILLKHKVQSLAYINDKYGSIKLGHCSQIFKSNPL